MQALGGEVTAISHSEKKKEEAIKLGAHHFIDSGNPAEIASAAKTVCESNTKIR